MSFPVRCIYIRKEREANDEDSEYELEITVLSTLPTMPCSYQRGGFSPSLHLMLNKVMQQHFSTHHLYTQLQQISFQSHANPAVMLVILLPSNRAIYLI